MFACLRRAGPRAAVRRGEQRSITDIPITKPLPGYVAAGQSLVLVGSRRKRDVRTPHDGGGVDDGRIPALRPLRELKRPETLLTTLPNGLRVVTEDTFSQVGSITMLIDGGSMYEPLDRRGASSMMLLASQAPSANFSEEDLLRLTEDHGLSTETTTGRDVIAYKAHALRGSIPIAVSVLADRMLRPRFSDEDVARARSTIAYQIEMGAYDAAVTMQYVLHEAAFGGESALGHREIPTVEEAERITADDLRGHAAKVIRTDHMVLAGAGVDHDELVRAAEREFGHLPNSSTLPALSEPDQAYRGSHAWRDHPLQPGQPGPLFTHITIGFPTVGWQDRRVIPLCVLDTLLGGGTSFSAGGPGKGMYTRLYREVLSQAPWVDSCNAFSVQFDKHGLWGVHGSCEVGDAPRLLQVLIEQLAATLRRRPTTEELHRAHSQLRSTVLMNLESRAILCEDLGRQVLTLGKRMPPDELVVKIRSVSDQDLHDVALDAMSHRPCVALLNAQSDDGLVDALAGSIERLVAEARSSPKYNAIFAGSAPSKRA